MGYIISVHVCMNGLLNSVYLGGKTVGQSSSFLMVFSLHIKLTKGENTPQTIKPSDIESYLLFHKKIQSVKYICSSIVQK